MGKIADELSKLFGGAEAAPVKDETPPVVQPEGTPDGSFPPATGETPPAQGEGDATKTPEGTPAAEATGKAAEGAGAEKTASLEAQIQELREMLVKTTAELRKATEETTEAEPAIPALTLPTTEFIKTDEEFNAVMGDRGQLNKLLQNAAQFGANSVIEHIAKVTPTLVAKLSTEQANTTYLVNTFWQQNKDLRKLPDAPTKAKEVYLDLERANPYKTVDELFEMLPGAIRKKYIPAQPAAVRQPTNMTPATNRAGSPAAGTPQMNPIRADIEAFKKV